MFDTLAVAQQLAAGGVAREQAEVIAKAIHDGLEQGDHVTSDQFRAGLAEVRSEIAGLRAEVSGQIAEVSGQVAEQRAEVSELRTEMANLDTRLSTQIADLRTEQKTGVAGVRTEIANLETRLIRWMVGTVIATATLTVGILRLIE